ncbi:hypothetical protein [Brevundimonas sp. UBA5866]|uniref:hypothetical protein n=1 Tax=Brevundimonas sp. UBA5866 TaxID=1946132 RepID=UPI0025BC2D5D|nr:hypothetical protein [Brevundimonas sp. UBA5866]
MWLSGLLAAGRTGFVTVARSINALGWAVIAAAVCLLLLLGTCSYHSKREADQARRDAEARARALEKNRKASERADVERMSDVVIIYNREKELTDAVSSLPDAAPGPRRLALACERLRQQGLRDADLPASCRPAG